MLTIGNEAYQCIDIRTGPYGAQVSTFRPLAGGFSVALFGEFPFVVGQRYRLEVHPVALDGTTQDHPSNPGDRTGLG